MSSRLLKNSKKRAFKKTLKRPRVPVIDISSDSDDVQELPTPNYLDNIEIPLKPEGEAPSQDEFYNGVGTRTTLRDPGVVSMWHLFTPTTTLYYRLQLW